MKEIIGEKPIMTCPSCSVKFSFDSGDIECDNEQYWAGLRWGYQVKAYRFVTCPICKHEIRLK
jgi:DNA-directed RNA polymerase subunit RPC12/RpoP